MPSNSDDQNAPQQPTPAEPGSSEPGSSEPSPSEPGSSEPSRLAKLFKRNNHHKHNNVAADPTQHTANIEEGLEKTRSGILGKLGNVFKGSFNPDDELFDELEEALISSDIGVDASLKLVAQLRQRVKQEKIQDAFGVIDGLRMEISEMLLRAEQPWPALQSLPANKPYVLLMVGVNGVGKTTTTAKIARYLSLQGKSVMLAAADTFRAAAVEQLQDWGRQLNIPVVAQQKGADAAAVAHDALTAAITRNIDVLLIDTAGRLHTQSDLMEQLQKIVRVLHKIDSAYPHEVMQVLDAGTGQNALVQLKHFHRAVDVSSLCLTKLDGSARGGLALALSENFKLPIRVVGVGEGFDDLRPFNADRFANALIDKATPDE